MNRSRPRRHGGGRASADGGGRRAHPARGRQRGRRRGRRRARLLGGRAAADRPGRRRLPARGRRGRGADAAGLLRRGARPRRRPVHARRAAGRRGVLRRRRAGLQLRRRRRAARTGSPAGLAAALERWGSLDAAALAAPAAAHGARGRRAQRRAGLRLRDPRADPRLTRGVARGLRPRRPGAARGRALPLAPSWPRRSSASAPRARRRSTRATSPTPWSTGSAPRGGQLTRADLAAYEPDRARAGARDLPRAPGPDQPAAVGRAGRCWRSPWRASTSARRAARWARHHRHRRRHGGGPGAAHAGLRRGPGRARLRRPPARLAPGLDDAHLGPRRRRPRVLGDVHATARARPSSCPAPASTSTTSWASRTSTRWASSPTRRGAGCPR